MDPRRSAREQEADRLVRDPSRGVRIFRGLSYHMFRFLSRIVGILVFDLRPFGSRRVARRGALVLASNHQSFLDPWLGGICLDRTVHFLARDTLFRIPVVGFFLRSLNTLPLPRGGASSRRGIELGRAVLRAGGSLMVFPEGTRSTDGTLGPLKRGLHLIVRSVAAPVLPIFVQGSYEAWPRHRMLPGAHPVRVLFGESIAARGAGDSGDSGGDDLGKDELKYGKRAGLLGSLEDSYRRLEPQARELCRAWASPWSDVSPGGRPFYHG